MVFSKNRQCGAVGKEVGSLGVGGWHGGVFSPCAGCMALDRLLTFSEG